MTEEEERKQSLCFTGHRPEKLNCGEADVRNMLKNAVDAALVQGFVTFISGMARGVDIWAAEIVLERKQSHPEIRLICALPYAGFEQSWRVAWQERYIRILRQADSVETICPAPSMASYQRRNRWMVDHSAWVIALYNGAAPLEARKRRLNMLKSMVWQ